MDSKEEIYCLPGRNVRLSEFNAMLGRCQLRHLNEYLAKRREIANLYFSELSTCEFVQCVSPKVLSASSFWKFPILLSSTELMTSISTQLKLENIASDSAYSPPLHLQPVMRSIYVNAW